MPVDPQKAEYLERQRQSYAASSSERICIACLEPKAYIGIDRGGRPFQKCRACQCTLFMKDITSWRGLSLMAQIIRDVTGMEIEKLWNLQRILDADADAMVVVNPALAAYRSSLNAPKTAAPVSNVGVTA